MFSIRHSGSRGTDTSRWRSAQRAISASVCSGSGTCSSTSIAQACRTRSRRTAGSRRASRGTPGWVPGAPPSPPGSRAPPGRSPPRAPAPAAEPTCAPVRPRRSPRPAASGVGRPEELVEGALEACHHAPHQRVGRAVLVIGVAGYDPLGRQRRRGLRLAALAHVRPTRRAAQRPRAAPAVSSSSRSPPVVRARGGQALAAPGS